VGAAVGPAGAAASGATVCQEVIADSLSRSERE
jgi:hypothetical protein